MRLLLPAYQKFYNALSNLNRFSNKNDFFDNISYLDAFFSEYRNITFVIQKSISKNDILNDIYVRLRDKHLKNSLSKWLLDKRNETVKQHPFELVKQVHISVYLPNATLALPVEIFTLENDAQFSSLEHSLKSFFDKLNLVEIHFSVEYIFGEKGNEINLLEKLIDGVRNMDNFLKEFKNEIKEECQYCNILYEKILELDILNLSPDILFCTDYLYVPKKKYFERGNIVTMSIKKHGSFELPRADLTSFDKMYENIEVGVNKPMDIFTKFILLHIFLSQHQRSLMSTFMVIYDNNTFTLTPFSSSVRTTCYRKANEIAKKIKTDKISQVFYVSEAYKYSDHDITKNTQIPHEERIQYRTKEILVFYKFERGINTQVLQFDRDKTNDMCYVARTIHNTINEKSEACLNFFTPIKAAFEKIDD